MPAFLGLAYEPILLPLWRRDYSKSTFKNPSGIAKSRSERAGRLFILIQAVREVFYFPVEKIRLRSGVVFMRIFVMQSLSGDLLKTEVAALRDVLVLCRSHWTGRRAWE